MTFNRADFDDALKKIEQYLGYLKGNEMAYDYLVQMWKNIDAQFEEKDGHPRVLELDWEYKFPCPEEQFKVRPGVNWQPMVFTKMERRVDWDAYVREVQHQTDLAYNQGVTWASGLAGYLESICAQFLEPDVVTLRDSILDTHRDVVMRLADAPNDDWAGLGNLNAHWTGDAAAAFNEFYLNYNDVLARSGWYMNLVNVGASAATKVVSSTQFGALEYVERMRDGLKAQLHQWADRGWQPRDPTTAEFPETLVDLVKVGDSALTVAADYVPGIGDVVDLRDNLKNIAGLVGDVADLAGVELPPKEQRVPVKSSDEIYTAITNALNDDLLKGFQDAMDRLNTGGAGGGSIAEQAFSATGVITLLEDDQEDGDLTLPEVTPVNLNGENDDY